MSTPEYMKRAAQNYREKFDLVQIRLPKGTKKEIESKTGKSVNAFINELVNQELKKYNSDQVPF